MNHGEKIQDQFTRQAQLFQASHRSAEDAIRQAIATSGVGPGDSVLDVACGPGILTCAFARHARHVTGIDITPGMLEQARRLQSESGVANVTWRHCDVYEMPFDDASFSMIISRYAFHHLEHPQRVLSEMRRVCHPDGCIVLIDSAPTDETAAAFNAMELARDPSHTKALTHREVSAMMAAQGLTIERSHLYAWEVDARGLLARSFPGDGDRDALMQAYAADIGHDALGMNARYIDGVLHVTFPTLITLARKAH